MLYGKGMFRVAPLLELKKLEAIFRHKVFSMLIVKGKISREMIAMLAGWRHSGFHVFCGKRIPPKEETAIEHLARYIIRVSFSQERMQYLADKRDDGSLGGRFYRTPGADTPGNGDFD